MSLSRILLSSLFKSMTGKAFEQAPEGSTFNIMGKQIQKYDPVLGTYNLLKNDPVIGEKIQGFKNAIAPMPFGTSQKQYNEYKGIVDSSFGLGSFENLISNIYGEGGIMQGYNPVSAFGRGPIQTIENRISNIMNRKAPQTDYSRNLILDLYNAKNQLSGGQGTPTTPEINLNALYDDLDQSSSSSDSGSSWSGGTGGFGGGFSTSSSGTEETF